ncbi:zinc-binding dehydrogenase [Herbiconiux flava]|uniref:NADPH:quinone reductase-like Zn-dependent oxidoreductase n=1 Tax=Herbiconiux flava TaxID=881268 RepID=A0A852SGZ1_9MICO|nr:zinc-binding dehydrogenase [Herbiconiux flava]NYD68844.1 NADPH:quinone reductase-like Zn-dependent oxidoreductase [Herbiconiux flava]GLK15585.1 NADPH:quinone reductase [Herbiconiux flava]
MSTDQITRIVLPGLVEPAGLEVVTGPLPRPAKGQLLVAVEATGISFAEQSMRKGRYFGQPAFPFTPGYDLVGTVVEVGAGGDERMLGRRVASMTKTGAWATRAVVEARDTVPVPAAVSAEDAETVVVNGVTAWQMLNRSARVRRGGTVLLFGANGGVGGILSQLALHQGVRVIGAASPRHHEALRAAGVEPVDYADPELEARVRELAPGGVDAVFDNVGDETARMSFRLLARGGVLVLYAIVGVLDDAALGGSLGLWGAFGRAIGQAVLWSAQPNGKRATFYDLWAGHRLRPVRFRRRLEADLGRVFALLENGVLTANIAARFPLTEAAAALALAESRTLNGKVLLLP